MKGERELPGKTEVSGENRSRGRESGIVGGKKGEESKLNRTQFDLVILNTRFRPLTNIY